MLLEAYWGYVTESACKDVDEVLTAVLSHRRKLVLVRSLEFANLRSINPWTWQPTPNFELLEMDERRSDAESCGLDTGMHTRTLTHTHACPPARTPAHSHTCPPS